MNTREKWMDRDHDVRMAMVSDQSLFIEITLRALKNTEAAGGLICASDQSIKSTLAMFAEYTEKRVNGLAMVDRFDESIMLIGPVIGQPKTKFGKAAYELLALSEGPDPEEMIAKMRAIAHDWLRERDYGVVLCETQVCDLEASDGTIIYAHKTATTL